MTVFFALLGLASDYRSVENGNLFTVDYSISIEQLAFNVLEFCGPQVPPTFIRQLSLILGLGDGRLDHVPMNVTTNYPLNSHVTLETTYSRRKVLVCLQLLIHSSGLQFSTIFS